MSFNYAGSDAGKAATLALFTGIIEFIMGFLNLGNTKLLETVYVCFNAIPCNLFIKDCHEGFIINSFPFSRLNWWRTEGLLFKENEQLLPFFLADIGTFVRSILNLERLILIYNVSTFGSILDPFMLIIPAEHDHHWIT